MAAENARNLKAPSSIPRTSPGTPGNAPPGPTEPTGSVPAEGSADLLAGTTELDQLIHGRVRLGIVSALAVAERLTFQELKDLLETTDGNLSAHARKLENGGYLVCWKAFVGRVPRTEYRLTDRGRRALERYLAHMEALIDRVREG